VTERKILGDLDFESELDNPDDHDGWYGSALVAEPVPAPDAEDLQAEEFHDDAGYNPEDTDRWPVPTEPAEPTSTHEGAEPLRDDPRVIRADDPEDTDWTGMLAPRKGRYGAPATESWQSRLSSSGAWDFKASAPGPWYRSKRAMAAVGGAAVAALVVSVVLLISRSPATDVEQSTSVSPTNPTSAEPAPSSAAPQLSTAGAPPPPPLPPPPPPPPPPAEEITAPPATRGYTPPRQSAPSQSDMPEIGVTRTPVTRKPMSATPPPPRAPDRNSSTPGDAPGGGWGPW
jgi:hypothetical protein